MQQYLGIRFDRRSRSVGIDYDTDIASVKEVIHQAAMSVESIFAQPPVEILVRELAASEVKIEVRFLVSSQRLSFLESTSQVAQSTLLYFARIMIKTSLQKEITV